MNKTANMKTAQTGSNLKLLCVLLLAALLISGCRKGNGDVPDLNTIIYSGTEGITIEFAPNAPPIRTTEEQKFPIIVKVINKGAAGSPNDVATGAILVVDAEKPRLSVGALEGTTNTDSNSIMLEGRKETHSDVGAADIFKTMATASKIETPTQDRTESIEGLILATICYAYQTELGTGICVDVDPYSISEIEKACTMEPLDFSDQGAPVAITRVEPNVVTLENNDKVVDLRVYFENVGGGFIVDKERIRTACSNSASSTSENLYNVVSIEGTLGGNGLDCDLTDKLNVVAAGKITLSDDADNFFYCRSTLKFNDLKTAFTSDLSIKLSYGYTETISKTIEIEGKAS
jgi:hypothetical protein